MTPDYAEELRIQLLTADTYHCARTQRDFRDASGETSDRLIDEARLLQRSAAALFKSGERLRDIRTGICPYCGRRRGGSLRSRQENPFCAGCLHERLMTAAHIVADRRAADDDLRDAPVSPGRLK